MFSESGTGLDGCTVLYLRPWLDGDTRFDVRTIVDGGVPASGRTGITKAHWRGSAGDLTGRKHIGSIGILISIRRAILSRLPEGRGNHGQASYQQ
jgi:hypothetical protein